MIFNVRMSRVPLRPLAYVMVSAVVMISLLAACGLKPRQYGPGEKPFWDREEQRDD